MIPRSDRDNVEEPTLRVVRHLSGSGNEVPPRPRPVTDRAEQGARRKAYPGDFTGTPDLAYAPQPDGRPDPGEIVWTWVPYEEDHSQGKDRPVLLIGRDGDWLLALMLTSKDHDRDHDQEARHGRHWQDIGSGAWDSQGRPSEVRVDRILRVDATAVRREGAVLDRARFDEVAAAVRAPRPEATHGHPARDGTILPHDSRPMELLPRFALVLTAGDPPRRRVIASSRPGTEPDSRGSHDDHPTPQVGHGRHRRHRPARR